MDEWLGGCLDGWMNGCMDGWMDEWVNRCLDDITDSMDMDLGKLLEMVRDKKALASCSPRGGKESDTTWRLNNTNQI